MEEERLRGGGRNEGRLEGMVLNGGDWRVRLDILYCFIENDRGGGRRSVEDCSWVGCWCDLGREMHRHDALSAVNIW